MISLGIDIGTTHTKVLALDRSAEETLALEASPTPTIHDADGDAHRPEDILETVVELMARVVASLDEPGAIASLSAASVGEEVVLLDGRQRSLADAIAWFDPRGTAEARAFEAGPGAELGIARRWPPDASFSLFKLLWLRDHRADAVRAATTWTDLGDYVLAGLGAEPTMDWSHASRAGAFDLVERGWDIETIEAAGLRVGMYPRLVASGTVIGTVSREMAARTRLPSDVAIVAGGHDHLVAAYGAGIRGASELFISAGTSEAHLALLPRPIEGPTGRYRLEQGCFVDRVHYYAHLGLPSGHVFRQWRGLLYEDVGEEVMYSEMEAEPDGADGVVFELLDDLRHGRLDRVPYSAGRATVMRAIQEGLARRSADIVAFLEEIGGTRFETIVAAGHPTRVPFWRQLRSAAYGRPLAIVDEPESAAFGAAVIASRALQATGSR